jgi:hypothetical protein
LSPALQARRLPRLNGDYTDAPGRTGSALRLGDQTLVIDPTTGQLLAWIDQDVAYTYTLHGWATRAP